MTAAQYVQQIPQGVKGTMDGAALIAVVSAWLGVMSTAITILATLAGLVWWGIRIYETKTMQAWLTRRRNKSKGEQ